MKVEELYYDGSCDDCDEWGTVFEIKSDGGKVYMKLCKSCLLDLLKAIVAR